MSDGKSVFSKFVEHGPKKERPEPEIPRGPMAQPEGPIDRLQIPTNRTDD